MVISPYQADTSVGVSEHPTPSSTRRKSDRRLEDASDRRGGASGDEMSGPGAGPGVKDPADGRTTRVHYLGGLTNQETVHDPVDAPRRSGCGEQLDQRVGLGFHRAPACPALRTAVAVVMFRGHDGKLARCQ
jgi:hypothetical protein